MGGLAKHPDCLIPRKLGTRTTDRLYEIKTCKNQIDLKLGTGDPCAGQERLKGSAKISKRLELFDFSENFGDEPPTGSENFVRFETDLNDGTGDPCAGQERLNGRAKDSSTVELFSFPENFGMDPPTGSAKSESFMVDLNDGTGDP